jgi:hypothetical protein
VHQRRSSTNVRERFDQMIPPITFEPDWSDVLARAGVRRRRWAALVLAGSLMIGVVVAVGAFAAAHGRFPWLTEAPGKPAPEAQVRKVRERYPGSSDVRLLLRERVGDNAYTLYGFATGSARCLRLVSGGADPGTTSACTSATELEDVVNPVVVLQANVSFANHGGSLPTVPNELATFGFIAGDIRRVDVVSDEGERRARVANGAFLEVVDSPGRGTWARRVMAVDDQGRAWTIPIAVLVEGQPTGIPRRPPQGPSIVERRVTDGTIGWLERGEPRGQSLAEAGIRLPAVEGIGKFHHVGVGKFARVIAPVPGDFLRLVVGKNPGVICEYLVTRGGVGGGCSPPARLFSQGPFYATYGFSGAGTQQAVVEGLASDDVARLQQFLANGSRRPIALRDNALLARAPLGLFPVRVVAYDGSGRIIGITTLRSPR